MVDGPPRPVANFLPPVIRENYGQWASHSLVAPGIMEHVSKTGKKVYTVRAADPPNGRYSTGTIRKISALARKYCGGYMRYTQAVNMEFFVDSPEKAQELKRELEALGFPVGGWGGHLWNLTSCAGFLHCALAATDAPSVAQALGNAMFKYYRDEELPAKLSMAVSGCPSSCGGSFLTDISISGIHTEIPIVLPSAKACDLQGTTQSCPVGAIQLETVDGERHIAIRKKLCIGCGLCLAACSGIVFETPEKTDGHVIEIGGKASVSRTGTTMGRVVVPFLPNDAPHYPVTVKTVERIVDTWKKDAKKGERIADWIDRIGWEKFYRKTKLPFYEQSMETLDIRGIMTIKDSSGR